MISEERLKRAVHEAAEALDRSLPDPEACTYEPSPEFEARMQTLIREMGEKRERKERRRKLAHRAACLAIAVVACGGCFLGSNAQAREGLWGWIRDSFEGSQNYSFQSTPIPSGDLPAYTMDVPEEYHYVADQSIQSAEYAALTYENDAGNILALDYLSMRRKTPPAVSASLPTRRTCRRSPSTASPPTSMWGRTRTAPVSSSGWTRRPQRFSA